MRTMRRCPVAADDVVMRTEKLTKIYPGGIKAVDELDLDGAPGRDLRSARPERRGQDDDRGHAHDARDPHQRARVRRRHRRRRAPDRGQAGDRRRAPDATRSTARSRCGRTSTSTAGSSGCRTPTPAAEADRLLQQFRLADRGKEPVLALSGGMAQRLMVARAIMHRPAMLFLDEPTAGLDPQSRIALWEILGELHADGQTILLTTHYMEEADELCDRLAIIDHGQLLALGTPAELKRSIGADTMVTVSATGDLDRLAKVLRDRGAGRAASDPRRRHRAGRGAGAAGRAARGRSPSPNATASRCRTSPSPSPRSRPSSSTSPGRTCANDCRHASPAPRPRWRRPASRVAAARVAFRALLLRDLVVLRKTLKEFIPRTILQPFLLVFVFTYVFPKIGQGVGGTGAGERVLDPARRRRRRARDPVPGHPVGRRCRWCRSSATRARSRTASWRRCRSALVAIEKVIWGALSGLFAALLVFPIAAVVPATPGAPPRQLAGAAHAHAARLLHVRRARAHLRHPLRPPHGADAVRDHRASRSRSSAASTTRGRRWSRSGGCRCSCS